MFWSGLYPPNFAVPTFAHNQSRSALRMQSDATVCRLHYVPGPGRDGGFKSHRLRNKSAGQRHIRNSQMCELPTSAQFFPQSRHVSPITDRFQLSMTPGESPESKGARLVTRDVPLEVPMREFLSNTPDGNWPVRRTRNRSTRSLEARERTRKPSRQGSPSGSTIPMIVRHVLSPVSSAVVRTVPCRPRSACSHPLKLRPRRRDRLSVASAQRRRARELAGVVDICAAVRRPDMVGDEGVRVDSVPTR